VAARRSDAAPAAVPAAYRLDILGILLFAIGLTSDIVWHTIFGLETSVESLMSPPHVFLVTGTFFMASSPFRAAWEDAGTGRPAPSLRAFMPPLLSIMLVASMVAHVIIYLWGFSSSHYMSPATFARLATMPLSPWEAKVMRDVLHAMGIGNIFLSTLVLLTPILIMLSRWRLPFGAVTVFLTGTIALMAAVTGFFMPTILAVPVVTGLIADWGYRRLEPSLSRIGALRAFAVTVPIVLWSLYILAVHVQFGMAWTPELWAGVVLWTGVEGLGLSLLAAPGR
jgi:hypothetical protein